MYSLGMDWLLLGCLVEQETRDCVSVHQSDGVVDESYEKRLES